MTTITTELRKALAAVTPGDRHFDDNFGLSVTSENPSELAIQHARGSNGESDMRFIALCSPRNIGALLDALEAKDKQIADLTITLANSEKGRNVLYDINTEISRVNHESTRRIAELEAQALRLETSCDRNYVAGLQEGWNFGDAGDNDGLAQCIESRQKYIREAQTEQQPVAYMHHSGQVITREECCDDEIFAICCKVETPLYASAPAAQPVTVKLPDVEKWRSVDAVRAQQAYRVLVNNALTAAGITIAEGE